MSDNYRITLQIELYNQHEMAYDKRGELIISILKNAVESRLRDLDFPNEGFFVSASGY